MAKPIAFPADVATAIKIHKRTELALEGGMATAGFAHPELAPHELKREVVWASLRWAYRALDEVAGIVPMPESEEDIDVAEFAEGTPTEEEK